MNIQKQVLACLAEVYAVCAIDFSGKACFLAATESHGQCLLFTPPEWSSSEVWSKPGGTMSLVPLPQNPGMFLAIQNFFPIFKSENADIVLVKFNHAQKQWDVKHIVDLPFVHRFDILCAGTKQYMVASTLCAAKKYQEDWSQPGMVYVGEIPDNPEGKWSLQPLIQGITRNHGMCAAVFEQQQVILVSGDEGVFLIKAPNPTNKDWNYERLIDHAVGDVCVYDIDGDGHNEIITIEPFHGDTLRIYKNDGDCWKSVFSTSLNFGHTIWSGKILGTDSILVGNRGGDKELAVLSPVGGDLQRMKRVVIEKGVGPTQTTVINQSDKTLILSANHARGEVALYTLTQ